MNKVAQSPVREEESIKTEKNPTVPFKGKMESLEKLNVSYDELNEAFAKLKHCFQVYKTKTFFSPHSEFQKPFLDHVKLIEAELLSMGNLLQKERGDQPESKESLNISVNGTDITHLPNQTPEHLDIPEKTNGVGNITPPASEVSNEEILARTLETSDNNNKKRKGRVSTESPPKVKRLRRTLLDEYLIKKEEKEESDKDKDNGEKKEDNDDEEEEEFEVQSIIDFKKSLGQYLYHVTWKGYGIEDSTWEPSSNLTSCEELLVDFFKKKFKQRDKENPNLEDLGFQMHYDPSIKETIRKAAHQYFCESSREEYKDILTQFFALKTMSPSMKVDADELIERAITARKRDRYHKYVKMIMEEKVFSEIKVKREIQLAELRKWERKINSICSDPAKLFVENNIDLEMPPLDFVYINECRAGEGVTLPSDPPVGCDCQDCSISKTCCNSQMGSWTPYNKLGRVRVSLGTAIYECNKRCSCGPNCSNRVVQKGRTISLCIFRTSNGRGWGVKTLENIKKDSLVTEYVGEVITSEEAERRGQIYDAQKCTYLFDLDYNKGDQNPYTVDAAKFGNVSHFINHSCDPNLVVYNVWVDCLDPDLPRLALFATQDIKKGEELTFDYNSGLENEPNAMKENKSEGSSTPNKNGETHDSPSEHFMKTPKGNRGLQYGKTQCRCGAANCRQYFF